MAGLRPRREVNYNAPAGGSGTPAWLKAENKASKNADGDQSPELRPRALLGDAGRPSAAAHAHAAAGAKPAKKSGAAAHTKPQVAAGQGKGQKEATREVGGPGGSGSGRAGAPQPRMPASLEALPLSERLQAAKAIQGTSAEGQLAKSAGAKKRKSAPAARRGGVQVGPGVQSDDDGAAAEIGAAAAAAAAAEPKGKAGQKLGKQDVKKARKSAPASVQPVKAEQVPAERAEEEQPRGKKAAKGKAAATAAAGAAAAAAEAAARLAAAPKLGGKGGAPAEEPACSEPASSHRPQPSSQGATSKGKSRPHGGSSSKGGSGGSGGSGDAHEAGTKRSSKASGSRKRKAPTPQDKAGEGEGAGGGGGHDGPASEGTAHTTAANKRARTFQDPSAAAGRSAKGQEEAPQPKASGRGRGSGEPKQQQAAQLQGCAGEQELARPGPAAAAASNQNRKAASAPAAAVGGAKARGRKGSAAAAGQPAEPSAGMQGGAAVEAREEEDPVLGTIAAQDEQDYGKLMRNYRRLLDMYSSLKNQKIGQLDALVEEQDASLVAVREEVKKSEEYWKREAKMQRQAAASVQAEETQRRMKFMQDELVKAKAAVHDAEKALKLRDLEIIERDKRLAELEAEAQAAGTAQRAESIGLDPMSAGPKASAGAARTPSGSARPLAPSPGVGVQFPTPAAPPVPSPGVGVQFPTPYQTPGGINASLFGGGPAAAGAAARHAGAGGAGAAGAAGSGSGVMPFARMHGAGSGESLGVRTGAGGGVTREQGTGTGSGSPVQGLVAGRRGASPLQLAVESIAAVDAQAGGFAFTGMDDCGGGARSAAGGASPEARETMLVELRQQLGARGGAAAAAGRAASQMQAGGRSGRQSLAQAGGKVLPCTPLAAGPSPVAGLRAPANTPAAAAATPVPRFFDAAGAPARTAAAGGQHQPPLVAGSASSHRLRPRTIGGAGEAGGVGTPVSMRRTPTRGGIPAGSGHIGSPSGSMRATPRTAGHTPSASLVPIRYLFGLDVKDMPAGQKGVMYTHRATGFTFQLAPAAPATASSLAVGATPCARPADDEEGSVGQVGWEEDLDEDEGEEEVAFVPLDLGTAGDCLPDFLKEPISFAASRKEQLVKIIFDSLALARKSNIGARGDKENAPGAGARRGKALKARMGGEAKAAAHEAAAEGLAA